MTFYIILACAVTIGIGIAAFKVGRMIERADHEYREEQWRWHN